MHVERRRRKRFSVEEGKVAFLTPGWPHATVVADVLDIGVGGLGLSCSAGQEEVVHSGKLALADSDLQVHVFGISFRTASNMPEEKGRRGKGNKSRLGVELDELTAKQISELELFIGANTTINRDQRLHFEDEALNTFQSLI